MQASERGRILGIVALLVLAGGATALLLYSRESTPSPAPVPVKEPAKDPLKELFGEELPKTTVKFTLRELPFEEHSQGLPTTGTWRGYPLLHDFTGDGLADLVVSNREEDGFNAWEASRTGPWTRRIEGLDRTLAYGPASAADMNGDKIPDLVLSAHTDSLRVYLNDGKMNWSIAGCLTKVDNPTLLIDLAVGKINDDAIADVVGIGMFDGGVNVLLGDGAAKAGPCAQPFADEPPPKNPGHAGLKRLPESRTIVGTKHMGRTIDLEDIDGDGIDDIITTIGWPTLGLRVYLTRPGQPFTWEDVSAGLPSPSIGNSLYAASAGRFIAGGWPQVAVCGLRDPKDKEPDTIGVYRYDPASKSWAHVDKGLPRASNYRDMAIADFDKDGNLDMVVMSLDDGAVILRGDGQGGFVSHGRIAGASGSGYLAVGDIDGDAWVDIVVVQSADNEHPEHGSVRALLNRPAVWEKP
jgi:hypothetical protein